MLIAPNQATWAIKPWQQQLRLINIQGSQNDFDNSDIKILISPDSIAINTVGGVTLALPTTTSH